MSGMSYLNQQGRANPLSAPNGRSQMETDGGFLKFDAPHGPVTTTQPDGGAGVQQWAEYFGLPRKEIPRDPAMQFGRENFDLPEAYKGSLLYLDLLIIYQVKLSQMYAITRLLPLRQWDQSMSIRWDIWKFDDGRLGRTPEETMSRMLTSRFDTSSATFHRWGLAFMLEHGFMNTPRGRMNYRCNLIQIANATIQTLCYGAIVALLSCSPMSFLPSQTMKGITNDNDRWSIFKEEIDQWACVHKLPSPVTWLWDKLAQKIRHRTGEEPNILFLPFGTRSSTARPDEVYYFLTGKPQDFNRGPQMPAASVFESLDYSIGDGVMEDPAYQERVAGQFGYMLAKHLANIKDCDYQTSMMDIAMIQERDNEFKRIVYAEVIEKSGLVKKDSTSGQWLKTELARAFFRENYSWGDYLDDVGMLDKWSDQLSNGSRTRLVEFVRRFGGSPDGNNPSAPAQNVNNRSFTTAGTPLLTADAMLLLNGAINRVAAGGGGGGGGGNVPPPAAPVANPSGSGSGSGSTARTTRARRGEAKTAPAPRGQMSMEERKTLFDRAFTYTDASTLDQWAIRYATLALSRTGDPFLGQALKDALDGRVFTYNGLITTASDSLAALDPNPDASKLYVILPIKAGQAVFTNTARNGWIAAAGSPEPTGGQIPAASLPELYPYVSAWARGSGSDAETNVLIRTLSTFYTTSRATNATAWPQVDSLGQTGLNEFIAVANDAAKTNAKIWAENVVAIYTDDRQLGFLLEGKQTLSGRFAAEAHVDRHDRLNKRSDGSSLALDETSPSGPTAAQVRSKQYIYRQAPVLTTLLGEENMYMLYDSLVNVPQLAEDKKAPVVPGTARRADWARPHYPLSDLAFEHLIVMVEDVYTKRSEDVEKKKAAMTSKQLEMKRNVTSDAVIQLLQEFAFQRLIDMKAVVDLPEWNELFVANLSARQLQVKAQELKFNDSLNATLNVIEAVLPRLSQDFLTEWHKKLPNDVLAALQNDTVAKTVETRGAGIGLLKEYFDAEVKKPQLSGKDVDSEDSKTAIPADQIRDLLKNLPIDDMELLRFGLERNMRPIVGAFLHKTYGTWVMGQAFAMLGDGRVGYTFQGHHDFQLQDDAIHKMHVGHWTLYAKPVVIRSDGVAHGFNIRALEYVGGNENTIWEINDPIHRAKFQEGLFHFRSIIPVPVRINRPDPMWVYDVTGAFNRHLGTTPDECTDPSLRIWANAWGIVQDLGNPLKRPIIPHDRVIGSNTLVFQATQLIFEEKTKALSGRVRGKGHWGENEYNGCCDIRRGLAVPLQKVNAPGVNAVSIVY